MKKIQKELFLHIILILIIFSSIFIFYQNKIIFFAIILLPLILYYFPIIILDPRKLAIFIFFFLIVFPQTYWYSDFVLVNTISATLLLLILSGFVLSNIRISNSFFYYFIFYFIIIVFSTSKGIIRGYDFKYILDETVKYLYYPIAFYFFLSFLNSKQDIDYIKKIFNFIIIFSIIATIEIISLYLFITKGERVLTRQGNIILIGLITSMAFFRGVDKKSLFERIYYFLSAVLISIGILVTMQRSLWLSTIFAIFVYFLLDFIIRKKEFKKVLINSLLILFILFSTFIVFNKINKGTEVIVERTENIQQGKVDISLAMRLYSFYKVFKMTKNNFLFGRGIGDSTIFPLLSSNKKSFVDNSFITLYWKMGLVGITLFIILFFKVFAKLIYIMKKSTDAFITTASIIIFSIFAGELLNSMACVVLTQYHYNFIWAFFIAVTEILLLKTHSNYQQKQLRI